MNTHEDNIWDLIYLYCKRVGIHEKQIKYISVEGHYGELFNGDWLEEKTKVSIKDITLN